MMAVIMFLVAVIGNWRHCSSLYTGIEEVTCYNKFEYEYNVLQKLIQLEEKIIEQDNTNAELKQELEDAREAIELNNKLITTEQSADDTTYTRWGRTTCPSGATLVYEGYTAGGLNTHTGAAANTLCLTSYPTWDKYIDGFSGGTRIYGAQYFTDGISAWSYLHNHDVPCVVCRVPRNNVLMVPGQNNCHDGYVLEYNGYLVAGAYADAASTEFICMDGDPETVDAGYEDKIGKIFRFVQGECGSLKCPPYVEGRELTCAVCSFSPTGQTQNLQPYN